MKKEPPQSLDALIQEFITAEDALQNILFSTQSFKDASVRLEQAQAGMLRAESSLKNESGELRELNRALEQANSSVHELIQEVKSMISAIKERTYALQEFQPEAWLVKFQQALVENHTEYQTSLLPLAQGIQELQEQYGTQQRQAAKSQRLIFWLLGILLLLGLGCLFFFVKLLQPDL